MAIKNYTTKTASLKATTADIRKLTATTVDASTINASSIMLGTGEETVDVLEVINNLGEIVETTGIKSIVPGDGIEVITTGEGATALTPIVKVSDDIATKTYADTAAATAVADGLEAGGSIADAISAAKEEAIANAEVTINAGTGITVDGEGKGTTFTVAVADTIATKTYAEEQASTARTAAEGTAAAALAEARTAITGEIGAAKKEATDYTDAEVKKVADDLAATDKKHGEDIATVQATIEALSTSGFSRVIVTDLPTTDINLNAIYLVKNENSEAGEYIEYIYVTDLGKFEQIGSTKTDLSGYVTAEALSTTLEGYTTDTEHTELAGKVTALETLTAQHTTDIAAAQAAADTAQGEVDALEIVVSTLSQTVADNQTTTDAAIALKADQSALDETDKTVAEHTAALKTLDETTIPAITGRLDAIEAIPTVEVVPSTGDGQYITVTPVTVEGVTTYTVGTTKGLEDRLDALDQFLSGNDGESLSELLAKKVDNVTGAANGIAISTTNTDNGRVATLTVTPGLVATGNTSVVTGGDVATAISTSAEATLAGAKGYTDEQITALKTALNAGEVTAANAAVSVTQTEGKITAVTVTKGEITESSINLVDGATVYAVTSAIDTRLSAVEQVAEALDTTIQNAINELDVESHGSNGITFKQVDGKGAISVTADTAVSAESTNVVTSAAVASAITASEATAAAAYAIKDTERVAAEAKEAAAVADEKAQAAQTTADSKVASVEAISSSTHFGSSLVSATADEEKNVTVIVTPASEWSVGTVKPDSSVTSVIDGKMSDGTTIDDGNLVDGTEMFKGNTALTTYVGDLAKLTNGTGMFSGCTALTTFCGNLGSLTNGTDMFAGCALDEESLIYIVDSLPVVTAGTITVGVAAGVDKAPYVTEAKAKGWDLV